MGLCHKTLADDELEALLLLIGDQMLSEEQNQVGI